MTPTPRNAPTTGPRFKLYADAPFRRIRQVAVDLLVLLWVYGCWRAGHAVHDATQRLAAPGRTLEGAGNSMGRNLAQAGSAAGDVPLVGDRLREPFTQAGHAADAIQSAGVQLQHVVGQLALVLGLVVALLPILLVLAVWLPVRVRFARRAGAAQRFVDADADLDLFALRAMANQPMHVLARVSDDPVSDWRRGDREVIRRLAVLELRDAGLRPPPVPTMAG